MSDIKKLINYLIEKNSEEQTHFGEGFLLTPISLDELKAFNAHFTKAFNFQPPNELLDILKISNGFSVNGLNVYSAKEQNEPYYLAGIIEANQEFHTEESLRNFVAFCDESSSRVVYNLKVNQFQIVDSFTWEELESFPTLTLAISSLLKTANIFE
ncbi:MAG: hypothetical protein ACJAVX_003459 [Pseudoalteromonas rhizosphaerae]|jgi:hypothetical protein|uniref:SMI1 / KNR4 family protein n=1 Tax=Pseudoalteromonas neustonica TaxID=1840331 RepID=A0ABY3F7M9_9GAMM|nr:MULTISPECIES: YrhA family protein [Pseudoalteromonas]MBB1302760.1 SMI1 / KNR4 family protein [Pseudoalteromonas sp. SR44-8]MBB1507373.1 SMI1 / KNR4 family protein [Pseudoalteromonas sp. SG41-1]TVU79992.1 SMI1 / KNR4 family protein [Pseudoalteromonas neustonica]